jgi:hypothetical protein
MHSHGKEFTDLNLNIVLSLRQVGFRRKIILAPVEKRFYYGHIERYLSTFDSKRSLLTYGLNGNFVKTKVETDKVKIYRLTDCKQALIHGF